jgi:signal transduction histidine kinase
MPETNNRLALLKRINATLSTWVAGLSWFRMTLLALITLIALNVISDNLRLSHNTRAIAHTNKNATPGPGAAGTPVTTGEMVARPCQPKRIMIGGKPVVVITEAGCLPAVPASSASGAIASHTQASVPDAAIKIEVPPSIGDDMEIADEADEDTRFDTQYTLGGWIKDIFSALLIAFFAYLAATKVIVRKTAESDARAQQATDTAEREAVQRQLVQARLKLMQAQVEPHFLFNTLAAVDYLIETNPPRASEMQKLLIDYLRAALPQMRQESSTLGRELSLIRPYLELLKLRIEDRLVYRIDVPQGLESTVFPPMVLQSLVENAIKHGIEPKPEGGQITVSAQVIDGKLQVEVADTGVGLQHGNVYAASTRGTGLGLDNIRERLALLYPGRSKLNLRSGSQGGTVAQLVIPYQADVNIPYDKL